ncbi:KH domain-containing, RNA-binding, signal transduction-associated protein 2 [Papilio machaon]|uniref:KH domain-containing, RNA-binding, signal transduction-associated protein 2 n=1 Tax=Papilio machaon TaxID=76193 RepID=A0A0N1PGU7_PAPMA|nr:KH domain-containing, RNA-binding, signal transduction-associated protein 2 [Papilio machaon]
MSEKYDKNGYNSSDFKRNSNQEPNAENLGDQDGENNPVNEKAGEYMRELLSEKIKLNNGKFPLSTRLLDQEVVRVQANGRVPQNDSKYVDVYRDKAVKVTVKVLVPVKDHPKFNFVGKLLGPKGNTMKQLQEETMCKMAVLGRGSFNFVGKLLGPKGNTMKQLQEETMCKMAVLGRGSVRDRQKEEELRNSLDPKYAHLMDELHVEISALAPPAEAHARIAYALAEVKKYLIPDSNDFIRQNQMRDMTERDVGPGIGPGPGPGPGRRALLEGPEVRAKNVMYSACTVTKRSFSYRDPILNTQSEVKRWHLKLNKLELLNFEQGQCSSDYIRSIKNILYDKRAVRGVPRGVPPPEDYYYERGQDRFYEEPYYKEDREYKPVRDVGSRRAPRYPRAAPYARPPNSWWSSSTMNRGAPGKTKVLSILDRARTAMETSYPYEDPYAVPEPPVRGVPRGVPPPEDYYYERGQDRFYEEPYYKEDREYKPVRDVGSRRAPRYPRAAPYARPPK